MRTQLVNLALLSLISIWGISCQQQAEQANTDKKAEKKAPKAKQQAKKEAKEEDIVLDQKNAAEILQAYASKHPESTVLLHTSMGDIKIRLYEDTPLHRANFIRLARKGYFDNTLFFRVIKDFMIQGGDTDDRSHRKKKKAAGNYFIPPEMKPEHIHKRGALAQARFYEDNPQKESAAFEFYIIQGVKYNNPMLDQFAKDNNLTFSDYQRKVYTSVGGAPHLDGEHTVYGEVVEGMDVVDKMASVEVDDSNWPLEDVELLTVEVLE